MGHSSATQKGYCHSLTAAGNIPPDDSYQIREEEDGE